MSDEEALDVGLHMIVVGVVIVSRLRVAVAVNKRALLDGLVVGARGELHRV
jgi:hypothetical protein